ncbi:MAG: SPOR domain-containing protein [Bacteroidia bacterium]|nr:SPOR domain-containing protein [Bacteroidia bacterium]
MFYFRFYTTLIILSGFVFPKPVAAQAYINLEGAQVFSTFKFSSKISDKDKIFTDNQAYAHTTVSAFSLVYQYEDANGFFILGGIGMRKAGSALVFSNLDYIWKMQYADIKAGIGYQFNKWRIKPYEALAPYYASLLNANQSIGQKSYDIKASKSIKNYDLGLFLALGFKATISKQISIFTEYNYILGLKNIETTADQYLYNRGFSIKLGLSLNVTSSAKTSKRVPKEPFEMLADKKEPGFIVDMPTTVLPPSKVPVTEPAASKNTIETLPIAAAPTKDLPVIEKKPEITETAVPKAEIPVIEDQSEEEEELESVKITSSSPTKSPSSTTKVSAKEASKSNDKNISPKNKVEKEPVARNRMPVKVIFKIQIGSVSKPLGINHPMLKNISGKIEKETGKDGKIRYYSGIFESYEEARAFLSIIKSKGGNEGAFVVAFKNGKQITVYEAKKLIEENE